MTQQEIEKRAESCVAWCRHVVNIHGWHLDQIKNIVADHLRALSPPPAPPFKCPDCRCHAGCCCCKPGHCGCKEASGPIEIDESVVF